MPEEFRQRVIQDILNADNDVIALISFRDKLGRALLGEDVLSDVEVVELEDVKRYVFKEGFNVTMSFGVTEIKKEDDLESALKKADNVLYKSKNTGRDKTTM